MDELPLNSPAPEPLPPRFVLRAAWIAVRLVLVFYFGRQGALFFYQGF